MKKFFNLFSGGFIFMMLTSIFIKAFAQNQQDITGAWHSENDGKKAILLIQEGYFTYTQYRAQEFILSWGGTCQLEGKKMNIAIEYNSQHKEEVGQQITLDLTLQNSGLQFKLDNKVTHWERMDEGIAPLAGVWQITEREQGGKLVSIHQTGTRKTLKMLTGTRFQWFAIDPGTKMFSGTGGGTYSFSNGRYTEHIEFFSRDNSRVGAQLTFDGKLVNGKWHHSGLSSKGDKIYEVWSRD